MPVFEMKKSEQPNPRASNRVGDFVNQKHNHESEDGELFTLQR